MKNEMLDKLEKAQEDLRQIFLEIDSMSPIADDWQELQRKNAIEGILEANNKLGFVRRYIESLRVKSNF